VEYHQPTGGGHFVIPTVYRQSKDRGGVPEVVPAQVELNDMTTSQLTSSPHTSSPLRSALYFRAVLAPLATETFTLQWDKEGRNSTSSVVPEVFNGPKEVSRLGLGYDNDPHTASAGFDEQSGLLTHLSVASHGKGCADVTKVELKQQMGQYVDANGGAYCLIEQTPALPLPKPFTVKLVRGPVFQEVVQSISFGSGLMQRIRLPSPSGAALSVDRPRFLELEHAAGRLPENRELVSMLDTDLCNEGTIHTEASGMSELYNRPLNASAPISQNYHAMVQTAVIRDETPCRADVRRQLSLATRRTMGVASLAHGRLEYMTMRRITSASDNQGPWPLDDRLAQRDTLRLSIASLHDAELGRSPMALDLEEPLVLFYVAPSAPTSPSPPHVDLAVGLPPSVWAEMTVRIQPPPLAPYALRLQNVVSESRSVYVPSLRAAFGLNMTRCTETTLSLQQTRTANAAVRLTWRAAGEAPGEQLGDETVHQVDPHCTEPLVLDPLDIRTFTFDLE